jgi:hypothetical protein
MTEIPVDVSEQEHLIFVTLSGRPSADSIVAMLRHLDELVATDPSLRVLIDETELRASFVRPGDIARFVEAWRAGPALRSTRIAVFTPNLAMFGLNRMFQGLGDTGEHMNAFRDRAAALAWLEQ